MSVHHEGKALTAREASAYFRVSDATLRTWANKGRIEFIRTKGGHRRYLLPPKASRANKYIIYARVSTRSQKDDLERQVQVLKHRYPNHRVISDIGSGINFERRGFRRILGYALRGDIKEIVVTNKDRLCRFGFGLLETIIKKTSNGKVVVLDSREKTAEEELVDDVISIITVFASKLYGRRSHKNKREIENPKGEASSDREGEETDSEDI